MQRFLKTEQQECPIGDLCGEPPLRRLLNRQGRLEPLGAVVDLDVGHPLDPLEAALAPRGEAERIAVSTGQDAISDVRGEQVLAGLGDGEAAIVAGGGGDLDASGARQKLGFVQQAGKGHAAPHLLGVPPARAVDGGSQLVVGGQVGVFEREVAF